MGSLTTRIPRKNAFNPSKVVTVDHEFFKIIEVGNIFHASDTTANIGAETTPADTIEIYFTTPADKIIVASFGAFCSTAGAIFTLREGWTAGGGASGDALTPICLNREEHKTTPSLSLKIQADTITSGGTVLDQKNLTAGKFDGGDFKDTHPWSLATSTNYGVSVYLSGAGVAEVTMHWYERLI